MANSEHVRLLGKGTEEWNSWRNESGERRPDLEGADLAEADLRNANLSGAQLAGATLAGAKLWRARLFEADLTDADLTDVAGQESDLSRTVLRGAKLTEARLLKADLFRADLTGATLNKANLLRARLTFASLDGADMSGADLANADLYGADLCGARLRNASLFSASLATAKLSDADLRGANLSFAKFSETDLSRADLSGANLQGASFIATKMDGTILRKAYVYGVGAWDLDLSKVADQADLIVTPPGQPTVTVDDLEVAQFIYLLLRNGKIRRVIDTIGEKSVLILGRFTADRKKVLEAIRRRLRELDFVPMLFDFDRPTQRDLTETVKTLAGLSRFIVADITNPRSSPLELQATVPDYMIPLVPILHEAEEPFSMFADLQRKYGGSDGWVLEVLRYDTVENLIRVLEPAVIRPALVKADQLLLRKAERIRSRHVREYGG